MDDRTRMNVRDYNFIETVALPDGAGSVESNGFDLNIPSSGQFLAPCELLLSAPALTNAQLGNAETMKYEVQDDTDSAFGSPRTLAKEVIVQTGNGAGANADQARFRLPTDCQRYVRIKATNSAAGDASGANMTVELLF